MIKQDIRDGYGVCVIDPHGDLVEDALKYIPPGSISILPFIFMLIGCFLLILINDVHTS